MEFSIKKFDAYHQRARSKPLTLQEANNKLGCKFVVLSADVQKAYADYKRHYTKIIMEENCAPGEPIQQRMLSFKHFLDKENLLQSGREQRKMVIGTHGKTQASRNINALRRLALDELKKDEEEFHQAVPLNIKAFSFKNKEKEKAEQQKILSEKLEQVNSVINSSAFLKHLKNMTKSLNAEEKKIWNDSLYFVPKDEVFQHLTSEKDIENLVLKHAFTNKNDVVKKLEQWKLAFNDPSKQGMAKEISITNRLNEEITVGNIAYSLQSCKKLIERVKELNDSMKSAYFLPLVNKKSITN